MATDNFHPDDVALQKELKPGDLIIATDVAFFEYDEEVKKKHIYSQQVGDVIMVNNPRVGSGMVSGTGLNGTAYTGRKSLGLGSSLSLGKFRRAVPEDEGYIATLPFWLNHLGISKHFKAYFYCSIFINVFLLLNLILIAAN